MAVAFDATTPDTSTTGASSITSGAFTVGSGANRAAFGFVGFGAGSPVSPNACKIGGSGGTALTALGAAITIGSFGRLRGYALATSVTGSTTAYGDTTGGGSQDELGLGMVTYTGVDQTTPAGTAVTNTGSITGATLAQATVNVTTVAGDTVVACAWYVDANAATNPTVDAATNCTLRYDIEGAALGYEGMGIVERVASGTTTAIGVDFSFAGASSGHWGIIAFVVNAASGGASYTLTADGGSFTLTGAAATLTYSGANKTLAADGGTFTLTGAAAGLAHGYKLSAGSGAFILTGSDALRDFAMAALGGSFTLTGGDATLTYTPAGNDPVMPADGGTFTLTGADATFAVAHRIAADGGSFTLTGADATLTRGPYVLAAGSGSFGLTGADAGLTWSNAPATSSAPPFRKPPIWVRLRVEDDEEEVPAEPAAIEQAVQRLVKRVVRTGTAKTPAITVEGEIPREQKRAIRAEFRSGFNRDAAVIAAKALLRQQQEQEDEETLLWLI